MITEETKGSWKKLKGQIQEQWGDLTDDDIEQTQGSLTQIAGKIQSRYGESLDEAKKKIRKLAEKANYSLQ